MARITVEDCENKTETAFDLVVLAAHRARQISNGAPINVERHNDKDTVIALREIAEDKIDAQQLLDSVIKSHQVNVHDVDDQIQLDSRAEIADNDAYSPKKNYTTNSSSVMKENLFEDIASNLTID